MDWTYQTAAYVAVALGLGVGVGVSVIIVLSAVISNKRNDDDEWK